MVLKDRIIVLENINLTAVQYQTGFISRELIVDQLTTPGMKVDVCGPPPMMESVLDYLSELETPKESIVTEEF